MKKIIFGFVIIVLVTNAVLSQSTWYLLPGLSGTLRDLHFINNQTGWVSGANGVYNTTNGGTNWTFLTNLGNDAVCFIDANTGVVAKNSSFSSTTNGGTTWNTFLNINNYDIVFTDNQNGFVLGTGNILKTTNAGQNWLQVHSQAGQLSAIHFINPNTGWACGVNGIIVKTTNGGNNWINQNYSAYPYYDIWFVNENTGWVTFYNYFNLKSTNGGSNWSSQSLPDQNGLALHFFNELHGRVVGANGRIYRTTNGGINWFTENSTTFQSLNEIFFASNDTGYICGNNGTLLKTVNAGSVTGVQPVSTEIPEKFSLSQNYPNPFNPVTNFEFQIADFGSVKLEIFDALGRNIETLVDSRLKPGIYRVDWSAAKYPTGIYFYKLRTKSFSDTKKMMLVK